MNQIDTYDGAVPAAQAPPEAAAPFDDADLAVAVAMVQKMLPGAGRDAGAARRTAERLRGQGFRAADLASDPTSWLYLAAYLDAAGRLFEKLRESLARQLARRCRAWGISPDDLMQVAWIKVQRAIESGNPVRGGEREARAYFLTVADNALKDMNRKAGRSREQPLAADVAAPEEDERIADLRESLAALPADQRKAVDLLLLGHTPKEIAPRMSRNPQQVYRLLDRARACLEKWFRQNDER